MRLRSLFLVLFAALLCANAALAQQELKQKLDAIADISDITALQSNDFAEKYEAFVTQYIYVKQPELGTFKQRIFVCHAGFDRPTLIVTEGYGAGYAANPRYREELSRLFNMNIVVVEYRYFLKSIPSPMNWDYLTVENSMNDLHKVRTLMGTIYKGKWVSTGVSKGGQTTIYYRVFYPNDVDVSVPYVAPALNRGVEDGRHEKFIATVPGTATDRKRVLDFQLEVEKRKATLMPRFKAFIEEKGYVYRVPVEEIYDYCVLEYSFALWQYGTPINSIPAVTASDDEIYRHWLAISDPQYFSYVTQYSAFDVQAARELGYYGYDTKPFKQYLSLKTTKDYLRRLMVPDGQEHIKWTSALVKRTEKFLEKNDYPMIFIYGAIDPWTASGVTDPKFFKGKENMHLFNDEGNSHRAKIGNVSAKNRNEILRLLTEWLGEQPFVQ